MFSAASRKKSLEKVESELNGFQVCSGLIACTYTCGHVLLDFGIKIHAAFRKILFFYHNFVVHDTYYKSFTNYMYMYMMTFNT